APTLSAHASVAVEDAGVPRLNAQRSAHALRQLFLHRCGNAGAGLVERVGLEILDLPAKKQVTPILLDVRPAIVEFQAALERCQLTGDSDRVATAGQITQLPFAVETVAVAGGRRGAESDRLALAFGEFDDDVTRHRSIRLWLALGSETRRGGVEQAGLRESGAVLVELVRRVALIRLPGRQLLEEVLAPAGKAVDLHIAEGGPATGLQLEGDL